MLVSKLLWQRVTPIIVGYSAGRAWKKKKSPSSNGVNFCAIFML